MKNILVLILLFFSISASAVKKTVYVYYESGIDYITIRLKNGTMKTLTAKDGDRYENFDDYYEFDKSLSKPTIVSGTSEAPCLGGVIFLTDSKYDADYVIRETTRNDYDCTMRIVNRSSMGCDEWQITTDRGYADHKVYISKDVSNYDYKVRIIR